MISVAREMASGARMTKDNDMAGRHSNDFRSATARIWLMGSLS